MHRKTGIAEPKLTLVLPTKDRGSFLLRWMHYADRIGCPFPILIADGGSDNSVADIVSEGSNFSSTQYTYLRYPYDRSSIEFHDKMADALSKVQTPFVAMADDDDFFIVPGLERAVTFLENHPDHIACRGRIDGFTVIPETHRAYGNHVDFYGLPVYAAASNDCQTATQRIQRHLSRYIITYYDVHRTPDLLRYFTLLRDLKLHSVFIGELLTSCLAVAEGKIRRDPYLYMVRQSNPENSNAARELKAADWFDQMLLESWSDDFNGFLNTVSTAIAKIDGNSLADAKSLVKDGYRKFMAPVLTNCLSKAVSASSVKQSGHMPLSFSNHTEQKRHIFPIYELITGLNPSIGASVETLYNVAFQDDNELLNLSGASADGDQITVFGPFDELKKQYAAWVETLHGESIIIWGSGQYYADMKACFNGISIRAIIDNDPSKHGRIIDSIPIHGPDYLIEDSFPVFICSHAKKEIYRQIKRDYPHIGVIP